MDLEVSEVLITYVTNRGKAEVMLHIGAGQSSNYQIILKLLGYHIFCNNLQCKKFKVNLEVSEVLITYVTNRGKAEVMLLIGAAERSNYQIILKLLGYDIFCNNLKCKKFKVNLEVSEVLITYVTNRGKAEVMLHIGGGQSSNYQIILELFGYDIFCNNLQFKKI